jgi:hypothetical protein
MSGTPFALPSPPSDVLLPPYARRLDVRATRAAFAAGTLGTVGDHPSGEDVQRDVVLRDANRYDPNVMHDPQFSPDGSASRKGRSRGDSVATPSVTQRTEARIGQERAVLPQKPGTAGGDGPSCITPLVVTAESFTESEAIRQGRLRRWQTIR